MESTIRLIDLLGAGALLIWGLRQIKSGVLSGFGGSMRDWIRRGTAGRYSAALSGFLVTLLLQSSTATASITASFAARGMIDPARAIAVLLGANVGTALAAVILAFDLHWLASVFLLIGVVLRTRSKQAQGRGLGRAILGLGMMLLALQLMNAVTLPLRDSVVLAQILQGLGQLPVVALLLAAGLAMATTSSLASCCWWRFWRNRGWCRQRWC